MILGVGSQEREFSSVQHVKIKTIHRVNKTYTSKQSMQIFILNANIAQRLTRISMENGNTKRLISFLNASAKCVKKDFIFPKDYESMHLFTQGKISTLVQTVDSCITA